MSCSVAVMHLARAAALLAAIACEGCMATALGLDRNYEPTPQSTQIAAERPRPAEGGCMKAYPTGCSAHPSIPQRWVSKRDR